MALRYPAKFGTFAPRGAVAARPWLVGGDVRGLEERSGRAERQQYRGRFSHAPAFGAESFTQAGVECSVAQIEQAGGDTWKNFCDCAFLQPGSVPVWQYDGKNLMPVPGLDWTTGEGLAALVRNIANFDPKKLRLTQLSAPVRTDDWNKCMSKWCLLPTGCWNPSKNITAPDAESWDGFNTHPGILFAPWTELGAAARGIPKRNAGFWYGAASAIAISIDDYEPMKLFATQFINPARYVFLRGFADVFLGGAAELYFATLQASAVAEATTLIASGDAGRAHVMKALILPLSQFGFAIIGIFLGLFGGGVPAAIAAVIKFEAQQVMNQGAAPADPGPVLGILMAIAAYGDKLGDLFNPTKWAKGGTWADLGQFVRNVATSFDGGVREGIDIVGLALVTAGRMVEDLQRGDAFDVALDRACSGFFGFGYTEFLASTADGTLATLFEHNKSRIDKQAVSLFKFIGPAIEGVIGALLFFTDALNWLAAFFGGWDLMKDLHDKLLDVRKFIVALEHVGDVLATGPSAMAVVTKVVAPKVQTAIAAKKAGAAAPVATTPPPVSRTFTAASATSLLANPMGQKAGGMPVAPPAKSSGATPLILAGAAAWLLL